MRSRTPALKVPARRPLVDLAMVVVSLLVSLAIIAHGLGASRSGMDLRGALVLAGSTLPLIAWRRFPLGVFLVTAAGAVVVAGLGYRHPFGIPVSATVALYLLAASREQRGWTPWMSAAALGMFGLYMGVTAAALGTFPWIALFPTALAWSAAWFAGERTRLLRARMTELRERAAEAEAAAEGERRLAIAEERARIARDLHDSAGHAINVIAVRAGAARLRHDADPDRSRVALTEIEEVARQTAAELDGILHSLRDDSPTAGSPAPPVGLASLSTLVGYHSASGLKIVLRSTGDQRPLPHTADQAAYRILQEALTNATRHGRGDASVELAYEAAALHITVTNRASVSTGMHGRRGHGLIGMKERATLVGGGLQAGQADGCFRVSVWIPYETGRTCHES